jgi:uncharacterized SAM-binding protein YcdF (DUF218 family)
VPRTTRQSAPPSPKAEIRLLDLVLRVAVAMLMLLVGTWGALDRIVAEKLATSLAMPAGLVWLLLSVSVLAARRTGRRDLILAAALPWTALTLLGNGMVAEALAQTLEQPYRQIQPLKSDPFDAIILLGGGTSFGGNRRIQGNSAGDRVLLTAQMYHAGLAKRIICTGHRIVQLDPDGLDPAEEAFTMLKSLGIPEESIELLAGRNTSEEMDLLGKSYGNSDQRIGLITSAWHLPRALLLAQRNDLTPKPLPADFITGPVSDFTTGTMVLKCIPQDGAMWTAARVLKEYLGILAGR